MKRVLLVLFLLGIAFAGISAKPAVEDTYVPSQTEAAYGYTHGGYVGMAKITVNADGALDVEIDEAFLPHTLGIVNIESDEWNEDNTTSYLSRGNTVYVAKLVNYNDKMYVGIQVGTGFSYVEADESGEAIGSLDLEKAILRNQSTMAAYYDAIAAGKFGVYTTLGGEAMPVTTTSYGGVTKRNAPGYWAFGIGWRGNIEAIETFAEENGAQFSLSEMVRATEEDADVKRFWSVADAVTAATNSDFKDYFGLVQAAAGRLKIK